LAEWVAFHYLVGFRKFYIFLHKCADNSAEVVGALKQHFDIQLFGVPEDADAPQLGCYQFAYANFGHEVDWMAFLDGDEFLYSTSEDLLQTALEEYSYRRLSALGVYWACYGSSGHIEEPSGLIIENYRRRGDLNIPVNRHVKSIVLGRQGALIRPGTDPHVFRTPLGTFDESLRPIDGGLTGYQPVYRKFRINHYMTQSRSYYETFKRDKGTPMDSHRAAFVRPESWWIASDTNEIDDGSMDRFIAPLKKVLTSMM
jgi:hypothetical protein